MYVKQPGYKSIKVPDWVYENWKRTETEIARRGLRSVPQKVLQPNQCPVCASQMQVLKLKYEYLKCNQCGYCQQNFSVTSNFFGGVLLGLGLSALLTALAQPSKPRKRRKS